MTITKKIAPNTINNRLRETSVASSNVFFDIKSGKFFVGAPVGIAVGILVGAIVGADVGAFVTGQVHT